MSFLEGAAHSTTRADAVGVPPTAKIRFDFSYAKLDSAAIKRSRIVFQSIPPAMVFSEFFDPPHQTGADTITCTDDEAAFQFLDTLSKSTTSGLTQGPAFTIADRLPALLGLDDMQIAPPQTAADSIKRPHRMHTSDKFDLTVTPRINGDNSITLQCRASCAGPDWHVPTPGAINCIRTVGNGETLAFKIPLRGKDSYLVVFATATIDTGIKPPRQSLVYFE